MKKLATILLLSTAFVPLFVYSKYLSPFIDAKVLFLRGVSFLVILLIGLVLISKSKNKEDREDIATSINILQKDRLFIFVSIGILLTILSTIFAFDKSMAFFGEPLRAEGFLTIISIYSLYVGYLLLFKKSEWSKFFVYTAITTIILFVVQSKQSFLGMYRSDSLMGNPIFLASYYLFSIFAGLCLVRFTKESKNNNYAYLGWVSIALSVIGILLTKTRGTILALFIGFFITTIASIFYGKNIYIRKISFRKLGVIAVSALILFSLLFIVTRSAPFWQKIPGLNRFAEIGISDNSSNSRIEYTKTSIKGFFSDKNPTRLMLGWGPVNYQFFWIKNYNPVFFYYDPGTADHAHNQVIDILVMSGILGLIIYIAVWTLVFKKIKQMFEKDFFTPLIIILCLSAYFINNLFAFDTAVTSLMFYVTIAFVSEVTFKKYEI